MQSQIALYMNTPTKQIYRVVPTQKSIKVNEMLISEISIVKKNPKVLYQIPFELSKHPTRKWKEVLLDSWPFFSKQVEYASDTTIWACHNRIIISNAPSELNKDTLSDLVSKAVAKTNNWVNLK